MKEKVLSALLAFTLVLSSVPMTSFVSADSTEEPNAVTEPTGDWPDTEVSTPSVTEDDTGKTDDDPSQPEKTDNDPDTTDVSTDTEETDRTKISSIYNQLNFEDKTYDGNTDVSLDGDKDELIETIKNYLNNDADSENQITIDDINVSFNFESENVSYYERKEEGKSDYQCGNKIVKTTIKGLTEAQKNKFTDDSESELTEDQKKVFSVVAKENEDEIVITKKSAAKISPIVISYKLDEKEENYNKVYDGTTAIHNGKVKVKINKGDGQLEKIINLSETNELALNKTVDNDGNEIITDKIRVEFANADAGEKKDITLSLINTGESGKPTTLANYSFSSDKKEKTATVETKATISRLTVTIDSQEIYYGQKTPEFTFTKNVDDGKLSSTLKVKIKDEKFVEGIDYLALGEYTLTAENANSNIVINDGTLNVIQYTEKPDATETEKKFPDATGKGSPQDGKYKYYYVDKIDLYAPKGYYINTTNDPSNFGENKFIEVELEETDDGGITYYLRHSDGTISEAKTFKYSCVKTEPKFVEATVEKVSEDKGLFYFQQYGIFTNDTEIKITVTVLGGSVDDDKLSMALQSDKLSIKSKKTSCEEIDGIYYYTATWDLYNNKYEGALEDISVIVSSQASSKTWNITVDKFTIDNNTDPQKICFDYTPVKIDITKANEVVIDGVDWYNIDSRDKKETITFDFSDIIKDGNGNVIDIPVSGIREIKIIDNTNTVLYKESFESNIVKSTSWSKTLSEFSEGKHEIKVTATDNVGNESEETYAFYVDYTPVKIDITKANEVVIDGVDWYNIDSRDKKETITFDFSDIIKDGNGNVIDIPVSGIREIKIIDNTNTVLYKESFESNIVKSTSWSKTLSEFSEGKHEIKVTATDNVGNESEETYAFYVDYTPVKIDITKANAVVIDNVDWYNIASKDKNETITFDFSDIIKDGNGNDTKISVSGIREIEITDNTEMIFNASFTDNITTSTEWSRALSEFSEGEHKIEVTATDNVGNESEETYAFYVDYTPVKIDITKANAVVIDNVDWYNIASKDKKETITFDFSDIIKDGNGNDTKISVSGIKEIEITDNTEMIFNASFTDNITTSTEWSRALSEFSEGEHKIEVIATDNVGNKSKETYTFHVDYTPVSIKPDITKAEGETAGYILIGDKKWYNKDNQNAEIKLSFEDTKKDENGNAIDSGIREIKITDKTDNNTKTIFNTSFTDNITTSTEWSRPLSEFSDGKHEIAVTATDNAGNKSEMNYTFYVDYTPVKIERDITKANAVVTDKVDWYNIASKDKNETIKFDFNDIIKDENGNVIDIPVSGIQEIKITDNGNDIITLYGNDKKTSWSRALSEFSEGKHEIKIIATDKTGNESQADYTFYADYTLPTFDEDTVEVIKSDGTKGEIVEIKGETDNSQWFSGDEYIKLKIPVNDENKNANGQEDIINNAVKYVKVTIQGSETKILEFSLSDENSNIEAENGQQYVVVSTNGLSPDMEHKYTIKAEIKDLADNTCNSFERIYYQDFSAPEITKAVVSKVEPSFGVLNCLPFGVYANTKLKLTISTKDEAFDSGIDYISVTYTDVYSQLKTEKISEFINNTETGTCDFIFLLDGKVSKSKIDIIVYDKYGKKSPICSNFENSGNTFVMIEENKPNLDMALSENDGVKTTDGKIWYKGIDGTDKEITIKVQDEESGLRDMKVTVTSATANQTITLTKDSNNKTFLTAESTSKKAERDTREYIFTLSKNALLKNKSFNGADGQYTIKVEVWDNSGNKNTVSETFYIDKTIPEINSITFSAAGNSTVINSNNIADYIEMLDYGYYFKADLTATVKVSDKQISSGLKSVSYQLIGADKKIVANNSVNIINGIAAFSVPKDFKGEVKVNVFDNVHNETGYQSPDALVIDTPSKHGEETHITISNLGKTSYKDANGNNLYTHNVSLTVTLKDTVSGLNEISYSTSAEKGSISTQKVVIENKDNYKKGDKIEGWTVTKTERNLVTEVTQTFTYAVDDNDIIMKFNIIDRAGNATSLSSEKFTVDKTAPVINVSFDEPNGNNEYYREVRTAEITVTERNFDMNRISAEIKNTFGAVPSVSFTKKSNTQYVANVTFKEGDYTFSINGTDRGNHTAKVNYLGKNTSKFYVDLTDPIETDNFNSFKNDKNNSFSTSQTMTFSITEHNFNKDLINIKIYTANAGQDLNSNTRKLTETSLIWNSNGDTHTTQISFDKEAVYQVEIEVKDLSGRLLSKKSSAIFEIDKTKPSLSKDSAQNGAVMITTNKENLDEFKDIIFKDANINRLVYTINVYQKVENAEQGYSVDYNSVTKEKRASGVISFAEDIQENIGVKDDSIYEIKAEAYDDAGSVSDSFICTYVIFEHSTFMAYVSNSSTGKYVFDGEGKRSKDIDDIKVVLYAVKGTKYKVEVGGEEWTEENGLEVTADKNKNINQIQCFNITILASEFKKRYSSVDTDIALNLNIGTDEETLSLGRVVIDNVEPSGRYDTSLLNLSWYDGFYNADTYEVKLVSIDSGIDETKILITDNGKQIPAKDFHYIEKDNVIKFTVSAGEHKIKVVLYDKAGNERPLDEITIYVGSFWERWWPVLITGIGIILAAGIITFLVIKKHKTSV